MALGVQTRNIKYDVFFIHWYFKQIINVEDLSVQ